MVFWRRKKTERVDVRHGEDATQMNPLRYLQPDCIRLDCLTEFLAPAEDETEAQARKRRLQTKESFLHECADILDRSGNIVNPTKFSKDLINRERKATTGIAPGLAIPHVRSSQVRLFTMGFARVDEPGLDFDSLDGSPTRIFFLLAGPNDRDKPDQDRIFLRLYRQIAEMMRHDWVLPALLDAENEQDVLNIFRGLVQN
jgi:mannitol/fructose-specific phosphotransferase system IIA component (Ntr-type)